MGFCPEFGCRALPARCIWQGSGFAADQTNAMLAVVRADDESLVPPQAAGLALSVARPLPTETSSLGFGWSPVGGGDKNSRFAFFQHFCVGGGIITLRPLCLCRNNPARGYFSRKSGFLRVGALRRRTRRSILHILLFCVPAWGWYHYPRRALHAVEMLDARRSRRRICRFYAAPEFALCGQNIPSAGTHATPALNRAHSGSRGETRRVLRVDGDDVFGSGIIDPIGPFQADQPVAVALAEGHRDTVPP